MIGKRYTFPEHRRGDTYYGQRFILSRPGIGPIDLTDALIRMQIRYGSTRGDVAKELSTANGGLAITGPAAGEFNIPPFPVDLDNPGEYYHDIEITFPDGSVKTYIYGTWTIIDDTTR